MTQDHREPTVQAKPSAPEGRLLHLYERVESLLISVVAFFLIVFVVIALLAVIGEVKGPLLAHPPDLTAPALKGIDAAFLAIILLESPHTTLSRGPISQQLQEFLVIGITAAVRHGLELAGEQPARGSDQSDDQCHRSAGADRGVVAGAAAAASRSTGAAGGGAAGDEHTSRC